MRVFSFCLFRRRIAGSDPLQHSKIFTLIENALLLKHPIEIFKPKNADQVVRMGLFQRPGTSQLSVPGSTDTYPGFRLLYSVDFFISVNSSISFIVYCPVS